MRVLIAGASGLVGGRLIRYVLELGDMQVRAASRIQRMWPGGVEGCVTDLASPSTLSDACEGIDAVINLASMGERACARDPYAALLVNDGGTLALASAAAKAGAARFVQVSTYKVYGDNPTGTVTEETPCRPRSHYAITHRSAEDYAALQHSDAVVLRLANGFGVPVGAAEGAWDIIVNEMCRQSAMDRQITIRSSGLAWRNFIPLSDVVRALHSAATGSLRAGTYNLGSPQSMTLRCLAERIAKVCRATLGFTPEVSIRALPSGDQPEPLEYRIEKLAMAGFTPTASFDDEVSRTLLAARDVFGRRP